MGSVSFSCDDIYFNRMGSVKLRQETTANGIRMESCDISLNPTITEPNACRLKWNPDPERIYKYRAQIGGSDVVDIVPDWSVMPVINANDISENVSPGFYTDDGVTKFTHPYSTINSPFCISDFSKTIDLKTVFLDYENNNGVANPSSTCSDSVSTVVTETVDIEKGVEGSGIYETTTYATLGPNLVTSQLNYVKLRESITYTVQPRWTNGRMRLTILVVYKSTMLKSQFLKLQVLPGNTISAIYQTPNEVVHTYQSGASHFYNGAQMQDTTYQNATGAITDDLVPENYVNTDSCPLSLTRDRRVGQPQTVVVSCRNDILLPHFENVTGTWSR